MKTKLLLLLIVFFISPVVLFGQILNRTTTSRDAYGLTLAVEDTAGLKEIKATNNGDIVWLKELYSGHVYGGGAFVQMAESDYAIDNVAVYDCGATDSVWVRVEYLQNTNEYKLSWSQLYYGDDTNDDALAIESLAAKARAKAGAGGITGKIYIDRTCYLKTTCDIPNLVTVYGGFTGYKSGFNYGIGGYVEVDVNSTSTNGIVIGDGGNQTDASHYSQFHDLLIAVATDCDTVLKLANVSYCEALKNIAIYHKPSTTPTVNCGIKIDYGYSPQLNNVRVFINNVKTGIYLYPYADCEMKQLYINNADTAMYFDNASCKFTLHNGFIEANNDLAIYVKKARNVEIKSYHFEANTADIKVDYCEYFGIFGSVLASAVACTFDSILSLNITENKISNPQLFTTSAMTYFLNFSGNYCYKYRTVSTDDWLLGVNSATNMFQYGNQWHNYDLASNPMRKIYNYDFASLDSAEATKINIYESGIFTETLDIQSDTLDLYGTCNWITSSEGFDQAQWSHTNINITADQEADPDEGTTADSLYINTAGGSVDIVYTGGYPEDLQIDRYYTISAYFKTGAGQTPITVKGFLGNYSYGSWVADTTLNRQTAQTITTSWQRFSWSLRAVETGQARASFRVFADSAEYIYMWGAQLTPGRDTTKYVGTANGASNYLQRGVTYLNGSLIQSTVSVTNSSYTVLAQNSGRIHLITDFANHTTIDLPEEKNGLYYKFIYVGGADDAQDHTIDSESDVNYFIGGVMFADTDAGAGADEINAGVYSNGNSNSKLIIYNMSAGTVLEFYCDGTNWHVTGRVFSDTVPLFADQ